MGRTRGCGCRRLGAHRLVGTIVVGIDGRSVGHRRHWRRRERWRCMPRVRGLRGLRRRLRLHGRSHRRRGCRRRALRDMWIAESCAAEFAKLGGAIALPAASCAYAHRRPRHGRRADVDDTRRCDGRRRRARGADRRRCGRAWRLRAVERVAARHAKSEAALVWMPAHRARRETRGERLRGARRARCARRAATELEVRCLWASARRRRLRHRRGRAESM